MLREFSWWLMVIFSSLAPFMLSSAVYFFSSLCKILYNWCCYCCYRLLYCASVLGFFMQWIFVGINIIWAHIMWKARNGCTFCKWYFMKTPHSKQIHVYKYAVLSVVVCSFTKFLHRHLFREYEWHPAGLYMHLSILLIN